MLAPFATCMDITPTIAKIFLNFKWLSLTSITIPLSLISPWLNKFTHHLLRQTPCPFTWCPVQLTRSSPPPTMVHQTCLFVASATMRRYLKLWPPQNTHGMTCTIARSSSLKNLCRNLTSFSWKPKISFMGNLTGSKIWFRHQSPSNKGTWPTSPQPSK